MALSPPEPLAPHHQVADFSCGEPSLDDWLKRRAKANQVSGASRTFVVRDGEKIAGYYALASGAVALKSAPGRLKRNMPDPVPVVTLVRLAVDSAYQGRGIGRALMRDATLRVIYAAGVIGIRGILVHAISQQAREFYCALGFEPSPLDPMTLLVTLQDLSAALAT